MSRCCCRACTRGARCARPRRLSGPRSSPWPRRGHGHRPGAHRTPTPGRSPISSSPTPCGRSPSTSWPCGSWAGWARTTAPRSICGRTGTRGARLPSLRRTGPGAAPSVPAPILATSAARHRGRRQRPLRSGRNGEDAIARWATPETCSASVAAPSSEMRSRMAIRRSWRRAMSRHRP